MKGKEGVVPKFRLILQGEGFNPEGRWFGFYAGREVVAATEQDACLAAKADLQADWDGPSRRLGTLSTVEIVSAWPRPRLIWRPFAGGGHTFYNDDADAQTAALRMEGRAVSAPRAVMASLLDDLG